MKEKQFVTGQNGDWAPPITCMAVNSCYSGSQCDSRIVYHAKRRASNFYLAFRGIGKQKGSAENSAEPLPGASAPQGGNTLDTSE
jgi:hypothetical protein